MKIIRDLIFRYFEYPSRKYQGSIESQVALVTGLSYENANSNSQTDFRKYVEQDLFELSLSTGPVTTLDVGCGFGRITNLLPNCIGIDLNSELITEAKIRFPSNHFKTYKRYENYPIESCSIDYLFSFASFIHCENFQEVKWNLAEIYRCLKKGGVAKINFRIAPRGFRQQIVYHFQLSRFILVIFKRKSLLIPWIRKNNGFYGVVVNERLFRKMLSEFLDVQHVSTTHNYSERTIFYTIKRL